MLTIGILIFPDAEELDFVGPFEVLSFVNKVRPDSSRVLFVAETADPVRAYNGMRVLPDTTLSACPQLDILVIPGGQGRRQAMKNPAILDFIKRQEPLASHITSVCTGSFLLAMCTTRRWKELSGRVLCTLPDFFAFCDKNWAMPCNCSCCFWR